MYSLKYKRYVLLIVRLLNGEISAYKFKSYRFTPDNEKWVIIPFKDTSLEINYYIVFDTHYVVWGIVLKEIETGFGLCYSPYNIFETKMLFSKRIPMKQGGNYDRN